MKPGYILIAGPQASGKSSVIEYISNKFQSIIVIDTYLKNNELICRLNEKSKKTIMPANLVILQEMRQIVLREKFIPGGRFIDWIGEIDIINRDINRIKKIIENNDNRVYVDETSLFTLAHALFSNIDVDTCMTEYIKLLSRMNTILIFLDINKNTSWSRRKEKYEYRVRDFPYEDKVKALKEYREYLDRVYPNLYTIFESFEFPKTKISTEQPIEDALFDVATKINEKARENNIELVERI